MGPADRRPVGNLSEGLPISGDYVKASGKSAFAAVSKTLFLSVSRHFLAFSKGCRQLAMRAGEKHKSAKKRNILAKKLN